ncbi:MAG: hypothetical protein A3I02_15535 [Betaproteobacteria bacterium RIFCSPLOWO2_02_FULL_67_26]|nr:MAG: hypothetical protein A3I02_15535 [Betaproteobacteria bacterium RIFCSPLOWO2_02_FULL_67_26]
MKEIVTHLFDDSNHAISIRFRIGDIEGLPFNIIAGHLKTSKVGMYKKLKSSFRLLVFMRLE